MQYGYLSLYGAKLHVHVLHTPRNIFAWKLSFIIFDPSVYIFLQAFLPLLRKGLDFPAPAGPLAMSRACVVQISTRMASVADNKGGGAYPYRASKVHVHVHNTYGSLTLSAKSFFLDSTSIESLRWQILLHVQCTVVIHVIFFPSFWGLCSLFLSLLFL